VSARDVPDIYQVPLVFRAEGVDDYVLHEHFGLEAPAPDLLDWEAITGKASEASKRVTIALVGKYVQLEDAYLSVCEALRHAAAQQDSRLHIDWVDSESVTGDEGHAARERLARADGILIPGGFGGRGIEGKIDAARLAREQKVARGVPAESLAQISPHFGRHESGGVRFEPAVQKREDCVPPREAREVIPVEFPARDGLNAACVFVADPRTGAQQQQLVLAARRGAPFQFRVFGACRHRNRLRVRRVGVPRQTRVRRPRARAVKST